MATIAGRVRTSSQRKLATANSLLASRLCPPIGEPAAYYPCFAAFTAYKHSISLIQHKYFIVLCCVLGYISYMKLWNRLEHWSYVDPDMEYYALPHIKLYTEPTYPTKGRQFTGIEERSWYMHFTVFKFHFCVKIVWNVLNIGRDEALRRYHAKRRL